MADNDSEFRDKAIIAAMQAMVTGCTGYTLDYRHIAQQAHDMAQALGDERAYRRGHMWSSEGNSNADSKTN